MTKKAFTLIELLIVITIITVMTASGVIYFFRQVSSMKLSSEIEKVVDIVDRFDGQVDSKKILDYSIKIDKNSLGFISKTNNLGLDNRQDINMNFVSGTGILSTNITGTGTNYNFKIFSGIKFQGKYVIDASETYEYDFSENIHSKISATLSGTILNDIFIDYYSEDNLIEDNENKLELIGIYGNNDKTGGNYNFVEIKNLNGKKYIIPDGGSDISKIYLFFEREGLEKFIEIKK